MSLIKIFFAYLLTFGAFIIIDLVWLGLIAKNFYARHLGPFLSPDVNWTAALIFYLLFVGGICFFVIYPALQQGSVFVALGYGLLFGLITYATYDLTNYATLKDWSLTVVVVDMVWGSVLSALVSISGFYIFSFIRSI